MFEIEYIFRIILAGVLGVLIGLERKNRAKEAGIRTHCVVACAAALMMVVSKYAFFDVVKEGIYNGVEVRLDPSRVASTIASGIGFLGAGMIFVHKNTVTGLTTAAGIWATSGVGMAIGAGMYTVGIATAIILILVQVLLHMNVHWMQVPRAKTLVISEVDKENYQAHLIYIFESMNIKMRDVSVEKSVENNTRKYVFTIELPNGITEDDILSSIEYNCKIKNVT